MKCAIYARYSSELQNEASIDSQLEGVREFLSKKDWQEVACFVDKAASGTTAANRVEFTRMIELAKTHDCPFNAIVVWDRSRFSRNPDDIAIYERSLNVRGIAVLSATEPNEKVYRRIKDLFNEFTVDAIREHTIRGQKHNVTQGGFSTGGSAPFGYRVEKVPDPNGGMDKSGRPRVKSTFNVDEKKAPIVVRVYEMYSSGIGLKAIANKLNHEGISSPNGKSWDTGGIRYMLGNETYLGTRCYGKQRKIKQENGKCTARVRSKDQWTTKSNAHPAIISKEVWDKVRARQKQVSGPPGQARKFYVRHLLSGIITCADCGASFIASGSGQGRLHYRCGYNSRRGPAVCKNARRINAKKIEECVVNVLCRGVLTAENVEYLVVKVNEILNRSKASYEDRQLALESALRKVEREIGNLIRFVQEGAAGFAEVGQAMKDCGLRKATLAHQLEELKEVMDRDVISVERAAIERHLFRLRDVLLAGPRERVREQIQVRVSAIKAYSDGAVSLKPKVGGILTQAGVAHSPSWAPSNKVCAS